MLAVKDLWRIFIAVLTQPKRFFKEDFATVTASQAIVVGALANVCNSICSWIISSLSQESYWEHFKSILDRLNEIPALKYIPFEKMAEKQDTILPAYLWHLAGLIFSPFTALVGIIGTAIMLMIGNALFGKKSVLWDDVLKIAALCTVPIVFTGFLGFIPFGFSSLIAGIFIVMLQLIALVEVFDLSGGRALGIIMTPTLFVLFCGCCLAVPFIFMFGMSFR